MIGWMEVDGWMDDWMDGWMDVIKSLFMKHYNDQNDHLSQCLAQMSAGVNESLVLCH